jgi:hypothetical protein
MSDIFLVKKEIKKKLVVQISSEMSEGFEKLKSLMETKSDIKVSDSQVFEAALKAAFEKKEYKQWIRTNK